MADTTIAFEGLNLISRDPAATIAFYRLLGYEIPEDDRFWTTTTGIHHVSGIPVGRQPPEFEFDSTDLAAEYNASFRARPGETLLGFRLASRQAVDDMVAKLKAAGHECRQEPVDAFWGARFAIVADPDGRDVGLQSPRDPAMRKEPPAL